MAEFDRLRCGRLHGRTADLALQWSYQNGSGPEIDPDQHDITGTDPIDNYLIYPQRAIYEERNIERQVPWNTLQLHGEFGAKNLSASDYPGPIDPTGRSLEPTKDIQHPLSQHMTLFTGESRRTSTRRPVFFYLANDINKKPSLKNIRAVFYLNHSGGGSSPIFG